MMRLGRIIPVLRFFDEPKAKEFYLDFLGFQLDWEHRFEVDLPLYFSVSKDDCVLHLSEHHGDACPGAALRIEVQGVDALRDELRSKHYKHARPEVEETPWGSRELTVKDPFGNRLTFTEPQAQAAAMRGLKFPDR